MSVPTPVALTARDVSDSLTPIRFDALLVVSFGGPEGMDDVMPFLGNVTRGRRIPPERLLSVARHYEQFGGMSPINAQNRALIQALEARLAHVGPVLPVYWGNRNWRPLLADTLREMAADGVQNALAFVTSAYSCYSCCRQYREDIERARDELGPDAPRVAKLRAFHNHPGFIEANARGLRNALDRLPPSRRAAARIAFTAHSVPLGMARSSPYETQLLETARLVAGQVEHPHWRLVYQSRSGTPSQPWLGPDIADHLRELGDAGVTDVVVAPIGFISDHMEVGYDLDVAAQSVADELGLNLVRAATAGTHPAFVEMIRELILERTSERAAPRCLGTAGPDHDECPPDCCLPG